jgi:thiamine pyrophosphate-dependent acetolactate synthase large subunit-like protein
MSTFPDSRFQDLRQFCDLASVEQEGDYQKSGLMEDIYPDFVMMANSFGVPAKRVTKPEELRPAIR